MTTYTVHADIEVEITNPSALNAVAALTGAGGASDEREQVQSAVNAGLAELPGIGGRYGFAVKSATATVE